LIAGTQKKIAFCLQINIYFKIRFLFMIAHTLKANKARSRILPKIFILLTGSIFSVFLLFGFCTAIQEDTTKTTTLQNSPEQAPSMSEVTENFERLSLEGSRFFPQSPILVQKDEEDTYTREMAALQWRPEDRIYLYLIVPKGAKKAPIVIYLYSYPSELDRFRNDEFCRNLAKSGIAAAGFSSALTGHRYSNRPMRQWFVSEMKEAIITTVHDIQMILNTLDGRDDLDTSSVGIFGQGSGGTIAILAAAADSRIKSLDLVNPWGDWPNWMRKSTLIPKEERPEFVKPSYLSTIAPLDPMLWLPRLTDRQIRVQIILSDSTNPRECLRRLAKKAPSMASIRTFRNYAAHSETFQNGTVFNWIMETFQQ
jgi:cephalosporin-C deacetylase-like acetyl esterase